MSALLLGARGVGKTQLIEAWSKETSKTLVFDLLSPEEFNRYLKDPTQMKVEIERALLDLTGSHPLRVAIDEIQKIPALLDVVHQLYAKHRGKVQFVVSGSSARKLKRGGANLLAGRLLSINLFPLTHREYPGELERKLLLGSLPGILIDNPQPERTLRTYVHTYLKEEILEEFIVRRLDAFSRFLEVAAQYHGKIINATSIAKAVGISPNSAISYFQILVDTLVGFFVPGWSGSTTKQLRTQPKFFLFDNGIASALRGELQLELTERTSRFGELFECWVTQEIFRMNEYHQKDFKIAYWQTNHGAEVDLVLSRGLGEPLAGIEIKSSTKPDASDFGSLKLFAQDHPGVKLFCFCRTPHSYTIGNIVVVPWDRGIDLLTSMF